MSTKIEPNDVVCKFVFNGMHTDAWYNDKTKKYDSLFYNLEFRPVSGSASEENKRFWEFTPSGEIKFGTINAEAAKSFEFGKEYFVIFRKAPERATETKDSHVAEIITVAAGITSQKVS